MAVRTRICPALRERVEQSGVGALPALRMLVVDVNEGPRAAIQVIMCSGFPLVHVDFARIIRRLSLRPDLGSASPANGGTSRGF